MTTLLEAINEAINAAAERGAQVVIWSLIGSGEPSLIAYASSRHGQRVRVAQRMWSYQEIQRMTYPECIVTDINQLVEGVLTRSAQSRHGAPAYTGGHHA